MSGPDANKDITNKVKVNVRLGLRIALIIIGISLCLISVSLYAGFNRFSRIQIEANKKDVNDQLCENNPENYFATAWIGVYTVSDGSLVCCNAGHTDPVIFRADEEGKPCWSMLSGEYNTVLGALSTFDEPFLEGRITLNSGDRLLLYTDGVTEAQIPHEELYGCERLMTFLNTNPDLHGRELIDGLYADIEGFTKGCPQFDDITLLLFEVG